MKKHIIPILASFLTAVVVFMSGLFFGRQISRPAIQVSAIISDGPTVVTTLPKETKAEIEVSFPLDINSATLDELIALPGIGEVLAHRIIDYRAEHGDFVAVDELMEVYGISDKRFENIQDLICIGGQ